MEVRRRVKEQQKRIGAAEFRNTHFSYVMGADGVEKFVLTPELQSENSIGGDPLEPGQVWSISPGGADEHPGLYRIEVNEGPGSGVKILNKPIPASFRESVGTRSRIFTPVPHNWWGTKILGIMSFPYNCGLLTPPNQERSSVSVF